MSASPRVVSSRRALLTGLVATAALGCATTWRWQPIAISEAKVGMWVVVTTTDRLLEGELVRIDRETLTLSRMGAHVPIPLASIVDLKVRVENHGVGSEVSAVLVSLGALLLIGFLVFSALLALASLASCPLVLLRRPRGRELLGEAYPGAVLGVLARWDAMPVPDLPAGEVWFDLENAAEETQITDALRVDLVEHDPDERVLPTADARLLRVGPRIGAQAVVDLDGVDVTDRVAGRPGAAWVTDLDVAVTRHPRPAAEGLVADLGAAPADAALELDLQSSPWLDLLSQQAWRALGERLAGVQRRGRDPARTEATHELLRRSGVHTRIEVREGDAWRLVGFLPPVGWMVRRRVVIPLGVPAGAPIQVRLTGGIGFLVVHEVAVTSVRGEARVVSLAPTSALADGRDERARLAAADGDPNRLVNPGDRVALRFDVPQAAAGRARTAFFTTFGWYEPHPTPDRGQPTFAVAVGEPEHLGAAGLDLYEQLQEQLQRGIRFDG